MVENNITSGKAEGGLPNYNWEDIQSGEGRVNYYLGVMADSTGDDYLMSNKTYFSEETYSEQQGLAATSTEYFDYDFDTTINKPMVLKGTALANLAAGIAINANATVNYIAKVTLQYYRSSEVDIVSEVTSATWSESSSGGAWEYFFKTLNVPLAISSRTKLLPGDILRLRVRIYADGNGGALSVNQGRIKLFHDPMGIEDGDSPDNTISKLVLPIVVQDI